MSMSTQDSDALGANVLTIALIGPDQQRRGAVAIALTGLQAGVTREFSSYPELDEVPRMLQDNYDVVIVDLDSTDRDRMLPGLAVKVEIQGRAVHDATLVPRAAIDFDAVPPRIRPVSGPPIDVDVELCDGQLCALRKGEGAKRAVDAP